MTVNAQFPGRPKRSFRRRVPAAARPGGGPSPAATSDHVGSMGVRNVEQVNTLIILEEPAQRRPGRRFADLVGDGLTCLGQTTPQAHLGQRVHQQA